MTKVGWYRQWSENRQDKAKNRYCLNVSKEFIWKREESCQLDEEIISNADPYELLYGSGSWIRKFSIRIQIRIRKFSIRIQGKSSNFNFFPQNLSKKTQFQILSTMQLQIYKYTEDFEESENKLYLLMLFYISAEKSPNLRTILIFIMAY